jgi:hypothetical protein
VSRIGEVYLLPVLQAVLAQFPFVVLGFHVDNGSEYINHRVAQMLDKLHAEFTKLCAGVEPVSEFSPALRLCHGEREGPWK